MRTSLMRMSLLTPALLALLISTSVLAQSTKSPRDEKGPISLSLGEITIDPNATRINKRQPILFKPLEMVDPATGKSVSPDYPIKLPSGKQITAGEYYAKVNEIERHLNEQGYSLRDKNTVFVQEVAIDEGLLSKQKKTAEAAHTKTDISPDRLFKQFGTDAVISGEAFRVDLAAAGINVKQAADMALEVKKIGLDMPTNRL